MKVVERYILSNGEHAQLEDWRENNTEQFPDLFGYTIAIYPMSQNDSKERIIKRGETFRCAVTNNKYAHYSNEDVLKDWEKLKSGEIEIKDLANRMDSKSKYYLGVIKHV